MRYVRMVIVLLLLAGGQADGASIGLFSTTDYDASCLELPIDAVSGTIYIVATGASAQVCGGLAGAEFSVGGLPAGWVAISTPSPLANISVGDPFGAGANIAFPNSQFSDDVLLYTVTLVRNPSTLEALLYVRAHEPPSSSEFNCPMVVGGDCPVDPNAACVDGGALVVASPGHCTIGVGEETWSRVKELYD